MIDLHSHIIPFVDDGATSFEETLEMLEICKKDGITTIAATPHMFSAAGRISNIPDFSDIFKNFKSRISASFTGIEIIFGGEIYFTSELVSALNKNHDLMTLNGGDYFLLEFPPSLIFPGSDKFIFELMNEGFIPVICHPERNLMIQKDPEILYKFLMTGALSQLDAGSIRGDFGTDARITAFKLLRSNMVHLISSDCHNIHGRKPGLSFLYDELSEFGKDKIDIYLKEIPESIVFNCPLPDIGTIENPKKKRSFFSLFKK